MMSGAGPVNRRRVMSVGVISTRGNEDVEERERECPADMDRVCAYV
jgi:hypothetical protein